jgi:hypothetical protein
MSLTKISCVWTLELASQLFGAEPPTALYRVTSHPEDVQTTPTTLQTIQNERMKTYLALSSSDLLSIYTGHSSRRRSRSSLSSISISPPFSDTTTNEVDPSQESEDNPTPALLFPDSDEDPNPTAHDSFKGPDDSATSRRRRLRAAKLSRFFGVNYNDLSSTMALAAPKSRTTNGVDSGACAGVGVKVQERSWFWKRSDTGSPGRVGTHDVDMNDVIKLLRQMPRA